MTLYDTKNGEPRGVLLNTDAIAALTALEPNLDKRSGSVFKRARKTGARSVQRLRRRLSGQGFQISGFTTSDTQPRVTWPCEDAP